MVNTTEAGHDPEALALIAGALRQRFADPLVAFCAAAEVFAALHDAGIRLVSRDDNAARSL